MKKNQKPKKTAKKVKGLRFEDCIDVINEEIEKGNKITRSFLSNTIWDFERGKIDESR